MSDNNSLQYLHAHVWHHQCLTTALSNISVPMRHHQPPTTTPGTLSGHCITAMLTCNSLRVPASCASQLEGRPNSSPPRNMRLPEHAPLSTSGPPQASGVRDRRLLGAHHLPDITPPLPKMRLLGVGASLSSPHHSLLDRKPPGNLYTSLNTAFLTSFPYPLLQRSWKDKTENAKRQNREWETW